MPKQVYNWGKVQAGDIISFRYKGKKTSGTLTTLLVFNPKLPYTKKDGTKTFHLVGLKLEDRGVVPMIKSKPVLAQLLERVGNVRVVSGEDQIYKVLISGTGSRGAKKSIYTRLKQHIEKHSVYRTYDYREAKRSQVFLEPIVLPKGFREALIEN
jgi:hypothetical protein